MVTVEAGKRVVFETEGPVIAADECLDPVMILSVVCKIVVETNGTEVVDRRTDVEDNVDTDVS